MIRVLGISGSPRDDGISELLLREALEAARREGAEIRMFRLSRIPIRFCMGCYSDDPASCEPSRCTQGQLADGMRGLHREVLAADCLLLATPVYWFSASAMVKAFVERLTSLENRGSESSLLEGKVGGLLAACEEEGALGALAPLMATLSWMGLLFPPYALVYSTGRKPEAEAMAEARRLGRNVVQLAALSSGALFH